MEWSKIKTMFIYLFLCLNLILIVFYFYTKNLNDTEIYQEKDAIIKSIKNDNIEIIEPQTKKDTLGYVSGSVHDFKDNNIKLDNYNYEILTDDYSRKLHLDFEQSIANIYNNNFKDALDLFIMEKLDKRFNYVFDSYNEKNNVVIYRQLIDNIKIYNSNALIEFKVEGDGSIKSMTQSALGDIKKEHLENIATYNQAIYKLYHENYIPNDSRVTSSLGYYTTASQLANQVLVPVWRIEVNYFGDRRYFYIDAINIKILDKNDK